MPNTLKVAPQSVSNVADALLDMASWAPESYVPGLIAALETVLHYDERPAAELVAEARAARA